MNVTNDFIELLLGDSVDPNLSLPDPELIAYFQDYKDRVIWMLGDVGDNAYTWMRQILDWNKQDKDLPIEKRTPIRIFIDNNGGSLERAKTFVEIISLSKTPIYGYAIGICASAASMIYVACHKRYATKNVTLLLHQGSAENLGGSYQEIQAFMDSYKADIQSMTEFYKAHTKISPEEVDDKLAKGDWYIKCDEAVEKGLIDEVIDSIDLLI